VRKGRQERTPPLRSWGTLRLCVNPVFPPRVMSQQTLQRGLRAPVLLRQLFPIEHPQHTLGERL
jgi:hypothetical protein